MSRTLGVLVLGAIVVATMSGCSSNRCGGGATSPTAAVAGLLDSARNPSATTSACRWIASGFAVSRSQLETLRDQFGGLPASKLTIVAGEQAGDEVVVRVSSPNGAAKRLFAVYSDGRGRFAVEYGDVVDGNTRMPGSQYTG
jgi:hypothetical protein